MIRYRLSAVKLGKIGGCATHQLRGTPRCTGLFCQVTKKFKDFLDGKKQVFLHNCLFQDLIVAIYWFVNLQIMFCKLQINVNQQNRPQVCKFANASLICTHPYFLKAAKNKHWRGRGRRQLFPGGKLLFNEFFSPNFLLRPGQLTKIFCWDRK